MPGINKPRSNFFTRPSLIYLLATLLFLLGTTNHAFVIVPNQLSSIPRNGDDSGIPSKDVSAKRVSYLRKSVAVSYSSFVHAVQSAMVHGLPAKILLVKDASGPLASIRESINYADPDVEAEFLMNISHVLLDFTAFFKFDGMILQYTQLIGRLAFITIDFLPGHAFHIEELAVQIFLLVVSVQKMIPYADEKPDYPGEEDSELMDLVLPEELMDSFTHDEAEVMKAREEEAETTETLS